MQYVYALSGKISLICYIFTLQRLWHLCQYGGVRSHVPALALGAAGCVGALVLWLAARKKYRKTESEKRNRSKIFWIEMFLFITASVFFAGKIIYSAIPYHGALSWKIEEWKNKKQISFRHNNIFESGIEGILADLDEALDLPEELYISSRFQTGFDETGIIQELDTLIYGKDKNGQTNTYLIDYDADDGETMTVWIDKNTDAAYDSGKLLSPMLEILKKTDWAGQVKVWSDTLGEQQTYELLYLGRRAFYSPEGLQFVPGDADGDGKEEGTGGLNMLRNGGAVSGFEISLHIPEESGVTPVRYIMEPEYISQAELAQENTALQSEKAKEEDRWTIDRSTETMYFFLNAQKGWRLVVTDAAAGSRFYRLEQTEDGGSTWNCVNADPFGGQTGAAEGLQFFDENFGAAGLTGASRSHSSIYLTRDGGVSFEKTELPFDQVTELPETAEAYGLTMEDYDYLSMPKQEGERLLIAVTSEEGETDGFIFLSEDQGITWEYQGVFQK